ncbi:MAG: hypothetical protein A2067_07365 [Deltaproteobacteria bacterium GWB2_42_7]|nr:MAG: hypothetical protein A2067_07365 [Deltaproteobacteria bacterium GWB2_42_7]
MYIGLLNPDARVVTVPPFILTFFTEPLLEIDSVQYTFIESTAMLRGLLSPDARVVTVPPFILTLFIVPPSSAQYTLVESMAMLL